LAAEVAARTQELSEALAQARQATEVKTRFLASISHELRTPLTAILGFSEELLARAPEALQPPLQRIHHAARLQRELIDDILDASRLESGRLSIDLQAVEPIPLIRQTLALLQPYADHKQLDLQLEPHWPLPAEVQADPLRLRQILLNLVGNAIKFSEQGEVRIQVAADPGRGEWWIEVIDSGVGIARDQQAHLFDAFAQADASTSRRYGGSGLGLYISRELTERMHGHIELDSTPGAGTRVRVRFRLPQPLRWSHAESAPAPGIAPAADLAVTPRLCGEVLIAEDAEDVRELLVGLVCATGAQAHPARDGGEALAMAERRAFDLLLLDLRMPVCDGLEVARRLREQGVQTPILLLTADLLDPAVATSPPPGCDALLAKPLERSRLYALLSRFLPGPARASQATDPSDEPIDQLETRLARRFAARLQTEAAALQRELEAGDRRAAMARLHRLKGSAPMFGRHDIGAAAARAEQALKNNEPLSEDWMRQPQAQLHADPEAQA
jgi:CheY-like chemotaxis protein/nitrogen-specific signal transduction histidine kinase